MHEFRKIISGYLEHVTDSNDRDIIQEALIMIDSEENINYDELNVLNEIFLSLKEDYTLKIIQDSEDLSFCVAIIKQDIPIIKNRHKLNTLSNELKAFSLNNTTSKIENTVLTFFEACEHIEENEFYLIKNIIKNLNNDWSLSPIKNEISQNEMIKISKLIPTYNKQIIIKKENDRK